MRGSHKQRQLRVPIGRREEKGDWGAASRERERERGSRATSVGQRGELADESGKIGAGRVGRGDGRSLEELAMELE
jgi:hypothetical protein